ncbi:MAG: tetratricopeptide repeat protein [Flavobacteriaceae bacterium]|jgi:tetratricopeptide (TPR) repeat protein|nr:tetratricopeptide repeat protein [Flavobacteriaceae bacterium]
MATYKKRGAKKSVTKTEVSENQTDSTTAEVFETLDTTASKAEEFVAKYQNLILVSIGLITIGVLGSLGYNSFVLEPTSKEAVGELNQAQYYFNLAVNGQDTDSLYALSIRGGEGKYGFDDIIENYSGTDAADLATFSAGMAYVNIKDFNSAINYLKDFSSDDVLLSALAKGAIGDSYAQLNQSEEALAYYIQAVDASENVYTTPRYLFKAGLLSSSLGKNNKALAYFKRIKSDFPNSDEASQIDIQIGRLENIN